MNEQPNELEDRLESLTRWRAGHEATLWESALEAPQAPRKLRMPPRYVLGIAAMVMLAAVGVWASIGLLERAESRPPVMAYALSEAPGELEHRVAHPFPAFERAYSMDQAHRSFDVEPRAIQRTATMELTTDTIRPLFDRVTAMIDPSLGEFVENASANEWRADATLRVSAQRLDAVMRSIREKEGVAEVVREELSAVDATDRRADLSARLANERRIEVELLELIERRPDAPLADVLRVREALNEVRLNIERLDAQRASLTERVALATLRIGIVRIANEPEPESEAGAGGFLDDMGAALARGGRTLAGSAAWIVEVAIGGLFAWALLAIVGIWAYRAMRWRATWA